MARTIVGIALLLTLWPVTLGGWTGYVTVDGTSMQPHLYTGDLVVVRKSDHYQVGDLVAFQLHGGNVIHRLHSGNSHSGFRTKGDNRTSEDPWTITPANIIGREWFVIPNVGSALTRLHAPVLLALALFMILMLDAGTSARRRRGRKSRKVLPVSTTTVRRIDGKSRQRLIAACATAALAVVALAATILAFLTPTQQATQTVTARQTVAFGYAASMQRSALYPTGHLSVSPDKNPSPAEAPALFRPLLKGLTMNVTWATPTPIRGVSGSYNVVARLSAANGWSKTIPLVAQTAFSGNRVSFKVPVNMPSLLRTADMINAQTQFAGTTGQLSIVPTIKAAGTLAGHHATLDTSPAFNFQVNGTLIQPDTQLTHQTSQPAWPTHTSATMVGIGPIALPLSVARILAAVVTVLAAYVTAILCAQLCRTWDRAIGYRLRSRFGVSLAKLGDAAGPPVSREVSLASLDDLARVAAGGQGVIFVRDDLDARRSYLAFSGGMTYAFKETDEQTHRPHAGHRASSRSQAGDRLIDMTLPQELEWASGVQVAGASAANGRVNGRKARTASASAETGPGLDG